MANAKPTKPRTRIHGVIKMGKVGRPPSLVIQACKLAFEERIPTLCDIADGKLKVKITYVTPSGATVEVEQEPTVADRLRAIDHLGRYADLINANQDSDASTSDEQIKAAALGGALAALGALTTRLAAGHAEEVAVALAGEVQSVDATG